MEDEECKIMLEIISKLIDAITVTHQTSERDNRWFKMMLLQKLTEVERKEVYDTQSARSGT